MANRWLNQFYYTLHKMPVLLDCNFIVDPANGNGLGIRSLKGPGIANVYMHTTATPAPGNPNPAPGVILVELQDTYFRYFGGFSGFEGPVGSSVTATVANTAYVITSLGTSTPAQWYAVGLPDNQIPTVGQAFVATASATIGGSATVAQPTFSGIDHIEAIGDPNQTITQPSQPQNNLFPYILLECYFEGAVTAPATNSVIGLGIYLSNSSVTVQGE
jgi:hypothetical protein